MEKFFLNDTDGYSIMTFEDIKAFFEPQKEIATKAQILEYKNINTIEAMQDYIDAYINVVCGIRYHNFLIEKM